MAEVTARANGLVYRLCARATSGRKCSDSRSNRTKKCTSIRIYMSPHAFTSLSPQDFEELVRDLLQAEWNVAIEAFTTGRDSGIDLRYAPTHGGATIVQCKHYAASGYRKLLSHLRNVELPKLVGLCPARYVVVTSNGLTPANKDEIVVAMQPFIKSTGDVLGAHDLEGLLKRHPSVEKSNFKLWLTSTVVLERVLHNAEQCHTDFSVKRIQRKLSRFVQNDAFPRARDLLDETRVVVISGMPGIGKTTLAELLLYAHLEQGYQPVVIQGDIAEGRKFFRPGVKQVFYYDDFLGQTFLGDRKEYLGRNQDTAIVNFVEMIQHSEHGRFILTTREHILRNALQISERLDHSLLFQRRCVIEMGDYSYGQKARILYNHLYFSDLPQAYRDAMLEDQFFLDIIKHEHFNPRLIEWLSTYTRLKNVPPNSYRAHVSGLLTSPDSIWSHAFNNQISAAARHVLLALYMIGQDVETIDLEPVFIALRHHCAAKYNEHTVPGEFRRALLELDGGFLTYSRNSARFLNPSVREFIAAVVIGDLDTAEDLLTSAVRFHQVVSLWKLAQSEHGNALANFLKEKEDLLFDALTRLLQGPSLRWENMPDGSRRGYYIDMRTEGRIEFLMEIATAHQSLQFAGLAVQASAGLAASWYHRLPEFGAAFKLLEMIGENTWFLSHGGCEAYRTLSDSIMKELNSAGASDWLEMIEFPNNALNWTDSDEDHFSNMLKEYCETGVDDEISACTSLDEMSDLNESLEKLAKKYGLSLDGAIFGLHEAIAEREGAPDYDEERSFGGGRSFTHQDIMSDDDVSQMFDTLRDSSTS